MIIKKEIDKLQEQLHKAFVQCGVLKTIVAGDASLLLSDELHKLTSELETLALQTRNLDEAYHVNVWDIAKKPYNKSWDAGIAGRVEVNENDWLHITLNTLLPHCKYQTSPYLKDTLIRLLSNYQLNGGTLPFYRTAMLIIDEHCNIENRQIFDQDNKGWKVVPNALKGLVISDDDQFSLGVALISTWDREISCHIHVMNIEDAGAFFSFQTGDCGSYFR